MRRRALAGLVVGLLLALPAAARPAGEKVTLKAGQTKPLETVFDKTEKVKLVMSGVITFTLTATGETDGYDPFHRLADCARAKGAHSVNLPIQDAHGNLIDVNDAGNPSCRSDHRYEFVVNENPLLSDLDGKAKAYVIFGPSEGRTASGSFTLTIEAGEKSKRRDLVFKVLATKELQATRSNRLSDARLGGAGRIVDIDQPGLGQKARGALSLTLVRKGRSDAHLTLRPTSGHYRANKKFAGLAAIVLKSGEPLCPKGTFFVISLYQNPMRAEAYASASSYPECGRALGRLAWREPASEIAVKLTVVQVTK